MNPGYTQGKMDPFYQEFFYGELVPPYIDVLGRGAHLRSSNDDNLKYQETAKCYRNQGRFGSILYQRFGDFYGPQYDIQTGITHQQYGKSSDETKYFAQSPPEGYHEDNNWKYFHGEGFVYIDLPHLRKFDPTYNCTPGIQLMNETYNRREDLKVYTSPINDLNGGYDIEQHPFFNETMGCFTKESFEDGETVECGIVSSGNQRAIQMGGDFFYPGTCEADKICDTDLDSEAEPCPEGFVCDEMTTTDSKNYYLCREGYYCDFGTDSERVRESTKRESTSIYCRAIEATRSYC